MAVRIVTDSGSDLTQEEARRLGVTLVPLYLRFGDKVYRDGMDMDSDEFFSKLETSPTRPYTSSPSPGDFAKAYEAAAREGDEIISIHVTGKHSATVASAKLGAEAAAKTIRRIEVIDSQGVSMWQGLVAIAAARAAEAGQNLQQVVEKVQETISQMRAVGLLDTLSYITRGGRVSKAILAIESVLNVKPFLTLRGGEIHLAGIVRTRGKGIERICEFFRSLPHLEEVAVIHAVNPDDARALVDYISSIIPDIVPRVAKLGPALGVHGGPKTLLAVARVGK